MRHTRWGIAASLAVALLCGTAGAAEKDTYQVPTAKKSSSWWSWDYWWPSGKGKKEEAAKKTAKAAKEKPKVDDSWESAVTRPAATKTLNAEASFLAKEQAKVLRRQQVCDKLREVARGSNDPSLEKQAQLLEERAWAIYEQRTVARHMPGSLTGEETTTADALTKPAATDRTSAARPQRSIMARMLGTSEGKEDRP